MSFWGELKRRNVYKVGVAYAIVAWLLIQAAAIIFPHLNLPSWATTFVIVILIIGFPIALLLAWAYEVTPEGIKRTKEVPLSESITHLTGKKLNYILAGVIVLAIAFILFDNYYLDRRAIEPEVATIKPEQVPAVVEVKETQKTIAVLPFDDLSPEKDQEYFVDGLSEEILNFLCQISGLEVMGKTSSFYFKGKNKKAQEIANELGVEYLLEGSVRKAGDSLRITAQLLRGTDGFHLWSKTYDRELKDIFAVQEDIAKAVADELKATLGIGQPLKQVGGTDNVEAYELYLIAKGQQQSVDSTKFSIPLEAVDKAIALDPEFALAWADKALIHMVLAENGPTDRVDSEFNSALRAAQKAIKLEPSLAEAYIDMGGYRSARGDWIEAELDFRKAIELIEEPSSTVVQISIHYLRVGYFKKAHELLETALRSDPLEQATNMFYVLSFGLLGDMKGAEEEYQRCRELFGVNWQGWTVTYTRLGADDLVTRDDILDSDLIDDVAKEHLDSPQEGLEELRRIYGTYDNLTNANFSDMSIWAAYFGDTAFAMDAQEKAFSITASRTWAVWYPVMKEVRQTPRFKEFIKKTGLVDYWNKFGWPDICHKLDNGDFECD